MDSLCLKDYNKNRYEFRAWDGPDIVHFIFTRYFYIIVLFAWVIMFLIEFFTIELKGRFPGELSITGILPFSILFLLFHYLLFRKHVYRILFYEDSISLFRMLKKDPLKFNLNELRSIKIGWFFYTYKFEDGSSFSFVDQSVENLRFLEKHEFPIAR